ncbi:MAG: hypothetical protein IK057_02085 [Clostridia bacterium]|nr:hypothetical protein [Clostridia bacterium]
MKKRFLSLILALLVVFSVQYASFAAYETSIPLNAQGNSSNLIYIKRPRSLSGSTSDKTYTISATGLQNTKVRVYRLTGNDVCELIKAERLIGASGLFSTVVDLPDSSNTFVIYAENGASDQVVKIQISKVKKSTVDKLRSVTVNVLNFLK